jgi:hypothetical protein
MLAAAVGTGRLKFCVPGFQARLTTCRWGGSVVNTALIDLCEKLVEGFGDLPTTTVVRVVTDRGEEFPDDDEHFLALAARARLCEASHHRDRP